MKPQTLALILLMFAVAAAAHAGDALTAGDHDLSISFGGLSRRYLVHVPARFEAAPPALVLVLHGGGGNAEHAVAMTGMNAVSDREGFVAVYPQGYTRLKRNLLCTWNVGFCCGPAMDARIDDVGFIGAVLDDLKPRLRYDDARVYVTGMSNGGMMAYRLACDMSHRVAAVAPVAGSMGDECRPSRPVSVLIIHGTADKHVLYGGGEPVAKLDPHPRVDRSVGAAKVFWSAFDGCVGTPDTVRTGAIEHETFKGCAQSTGVEVVTIHGGGHAWPGGAKGRVFGDPPTTELTASDVIWRFFKDKRR